MSFSRRNGELKIKRWNTANVINISETGKKRDTRTYVRKRITSTSNVFMQELRRFQRDRNGVSQEPSGRFTQTTANKHPHRYSEMLLNHR